MAVSRGPNCIPRAADQTERAQVRACRRPGDALDKGRTIYGAQDPSAWVADWKKRSEQALESRERTARKQARGDVHRRASRSERRQGTPRRRSPIGTIRARSTTRAWFRNRIHLNDALKLSKQPGPRQTATTAVPHARTTELQNDQPLTHDQQPEHRREEETDQ